MIEPSIEKRLLDIIGASGPLTSTLDALCRLAEDADRGSKGSILLLDREGERIRAAVGPSLPAGYMAALDGRPANPNFGPCGAAACFGNQVVSRDIAGDERWASEYRALASAHGLRACCATPIKSWQGRVLGTFAIYLNEPANPTAEQRSRIEQLTRVASIAIERADSIDVLRRSEDAHTLAIKGASDDKRSMATVVDAMPGLVAILSPVGEVDAVNNELVAYCGQPLEAMRQWGTNGTVHSEDLPRVTALMRHSISTGEPYDFEARIRRFDGAYRWNQVRGLPFRDASGQIVRWHVLLSDIDFSKRAGEALQLSEKRYERAMLAAEAGFWDWDVPNDQFYVSDKLLEMSGIPAGTRFASRTDFMARVPFFPDDRAAWLRAVRELFASGGTRLAMELRFSLDGETRWTLLSGMCVRDEAGKILRWTGSSTDVTARKRAEEALRESEQRYERAMLAAEAGFWDWDVATDKYYVSPKLLEMIRFPAGPDFVRRADFSARGAWHPGDLANWERAVKELFASGGTRLSGEMRTIHGAETRWYLLSGMCLRDSAGNVQRWTGSATDITDQKRAEEALRESEKRYERVMIASEAGLWDWDVVNDKYYLSQQMLVLSGLPPDMTFRGREEFMQRSPFYPEDRERYQEAVRQLLAGGGTRLAMEIRLLVNGETRWFNLVGMCFRDAEGKALRWTGSATQITDQKRAQEALRLSEERYALAMEASEEGHFDRNLQTDEIFASEHLKQVLDLPMDVQYRTYGDMVAQIPFYPGDGERIREMTRNVLAGAAVHHEFEYRLFRREVREPRWIRARWKIFRDAEGIAQRIIGVVSDITERKRAEDELRESEARFRTLTEHLSDSYWRQDEHLRYSFSTASINPPDGYLGVAAIGKMRWELPGIVPLSSSWDEHRALLAAHKPFRDFEYSRPSADGSLSYISTSGTPIFDENGEFRGYHGVARNITERKRAEAELRESEARFRALTELWSDWYWRQDKHLRFTYSSRENWPNDSSASSDIGMTRWEIPGAVPISISWAEHREQLAAHKRFRDFEYSRPIGDGTLRYVSSSGTPIFDDRGEFRGYQGVARDITERKRFEEELRSRQEMLEVAQKAARAAAFEWRVEARTGANRWSPDMEAMHGIPAGSYDGTQDAWKKLVHAEDWPNVRAALKTARETGDVDIEYRVIHRDGAIRWLQAKGRMFCDPEGNPERVVGFMLDVTDRHAAEQELHRIERQLRQAQRLEALGTLAGGIAHDFNNLLGAILGYGEMALHKARAGSRLRHDIEKIMIAGERGNALVERILAFSRSGIGERIAVHVENVARETLALFAAKLPRNIAVEQRMRAGRAAVMGDPTQIHQVLMNLLTNAMQAMPSGGKLRLSLDRIRLKAPRVVTNGSLKARDYVVIDVSDSGGGIAPEILERIFDPFFTTKEVGVGTGLGLSLVHGIVTGLGGAIDVASIVGKGSTFKVYVPLAADAVVQSKPKERAQPKTRRAGRGRVLIIDDEQALVRLVTEMLTESGYSPVGFIASEEALHAFVDNPKQFDAVITDESMPGMSGCELIRKMRALRPDLPILLVSGYLSAAVIERAKEAGATELMKKPFRSRQLQLALTRMLRRKRGRRKDEPTAPKVSRASDKRHKVRLKTK